MAGVRVEIHGGEGEDLGSEDHSFAADGHAGAGGGLPGVEGDAWGKRGGHELRGGDGPGDVGGVGGGGAGTFSVSLDLRFAAEGEFRFGEEGLAEVGGEVLFFGAVLQAAEGAEVTIKKGGEGVVGQHVVDGGLDGDFVFGFSGESGTGGGVLDALPDVVEDLHGGMAGVDVDFGVVGDDVGGAAAGGDDVVDAGLLGDVLAEEVDGVVEEHDGVEGGAALFGVRGGVGGDAAEAELGGDVGEGGFETGLIGVAGVPGEDGVDVFEGAGADHVDFAAAALFGGGTEDFERAFEALIAEGDGGEDGAGAEEVVAAAVAGGVGDAGVALGDVVLREAGEGVVFGHEADDGLAGAVGGDEGGGDVGDAGFDGEAGGFQFGLEESGAFALFVTDFGEFPDLAGDFAEVLGVSVDLGGDLSLER